MTVKILPTEIAELDKTISTLDIETLSLSLNAVVYEIGIVCTNFLPVPGVKWGTQHLEALTAMADESKGDLVFGYIKIRLSIIEQVLSGREIDTETVKFHDKVFDRRGLTALSEFTKHEQSALTTEQARVALRRLVAWHQPEEVWFNHTSFDVPRITSVLYNGVANSVPWNYRAEYDVFTAKQEYRNGLNDGDRDYTKFKSDNDHHDSIGDCLYNLAVVSACRFSERAARRMAL